MHSVTSTLFLPLSDIVFNIYPHQLEEEHRANCIVLRAREWSTIYLIGAHIVDSPVEWQAETLEIYYIVSDMIRTHVFCVQVEMFSLPHSVNVVAMNALPPELVSLELLNLPGRYGKAFRPWRFQPRLLPVGV